jgi:hypothetical protein
MSADLAIRKAKERGIKLLPEAEKLKLRAKVEPPQFLVDALRIHKVEILKILNGRPL